MKKRIFDWEHIKKVRSPVVFNYLKSVYQSDISQEQFVKEFSSLDRKGKLHANKTRGPHKARKIYINLKEIFGFFK